ncbi:leucyl aminopeptidase [Pelagerythrobacter marinus]|uniref:leucyl aminopeptidase n=1 Tax=Pelagerythrobacter marinus TaxID=538382 RepID=UPI0020368271|nr:leucyl aminopeptidase [Pelagerythrobacter marinus]USA38608.1 leucyl aminopeptidase [Pelagerythrobacter marinus]WPZ07366.1 leucyl aminopeptidase [Pelagerythrobacter marinus]
MNFEFSPSLPAGTRLIALVADKDGLPDGIEAPLAEGARSARFKGRAGELFEGFVERGGTVVRVALAGAGEPGAEGRTANLEKAGAALAARYLTSGESTLALDLSGSGLRAQDVAAVLLGLRLRAWRHDAYRTRLKDEQKRSLEKIVVVGAAEGSEAAWSVESALADGVEFTRELVTEPPNKVYPVSFVEKCQAAFADTGAELIVLDEDEMGRLGMGALLGVGQGSAQPSRLLAIRWNGGGDEAPTVFVGKGVTFDTGGISLKPGAGMEDMKWDMGGAGAVVGGMLAIARRKAKANVVGVVGLVENMPDGNAIRPGDILTSMSGQTIEVLNTDAEGRLVLCDALHWAQKEFSPRRIVDFATLTGAMVISLGSEHAGVFANDDSLAEDLLAAGRTSGDKLWRMPLDPAYDKLIDSQIADMKNVGPRPAGSITAAQFLQRFIDKGVAWAHCDVAGMVWADKPGATWDKGATGYGARLIDRFVRSTLEG